MVRIEFIAGANSQLCLMSNENYVIVEPKNKDIARKWLTILTIDAHGRLLFVGDHDWTSPRIAEICI